MSGRTWQVRLQWNNDSQRDLCSSVALNKKSVSYPHFVCVSCRWDMAYCSHSGTQDGGTATSSNSGSRRRLSTLHRKSDVQSLLSQLIGSVQPLGLNLKQRLDRLVLSASRAGRDLPGRLASRSLGRQREGKLIQGRRTAVSRGPFSPPASSGTALSSRSARMKVVVVG